MNNLNGKIAIVTGASKGIGAGIARKLAAAGAAVAVNYSSSQAAADEVVAAITKAGGKAVAIQGDVSKAADVQRLFAETKKLLGGLHILVNNAGVFRFGPLEELTEEDFHWHYNINVLGPILATKEALKYFGPDGGSVVNISSIVGSHPRVPGVLYASTKGAVDTLTRGLAQELAPRKIRVNAIAPGTTETDGTAAIGLFDGENRDQMSAATPLGRLGRPDDIADAVVFLAGDDSAWVTGEILRASGGLI